MAKKTLLELTQMILSSMDSDNVNSITDTVESQQVADLVQVAYEELMSRRDWPFMMKARQMQSVGDATKPTKLQIPTAVNTIDINNTGCFKYKVNLAADTRLAYRTLKYKEPCDFITHTHSADTSDDDVTIYTNDGGIDLFIRTNMMPTFWTSFDDEFVYLDSFDSSEESTIQGSKTIINPIEEPSWTVSDSFTPDLPSNMFTLLFNEAKALAHFELDQRINQKAEIIAHRHGIKLKNKGKKSNRDNSPISFGR